uniref:HAT C-terminal dimerisation domain-containing protein n=1 Tax=Sparus aurata TaxID=8175 RepID=A0A671XLS4_SPAAU
NLAYHSTTSNMRAHLENMHPNEHAMSGTQTKQPSLDSYFLPPATSSLSAAQRNLYTSQNRKAQKGQEPHLAEMVVKDLQPLSVVEDDGFRNFVRTLDPRYKIPNRKTLMEVKLPALYEDCCSQVRKALSGVDTVVLTTDMWTSRATEAYLTVSCQIIDENWQMLAYVLETCPVRGQHTADNICLQLTRIAEEWGITDKIQAVITDNGANMVAAVLKAGWAHYPCFAHTLNLVVKDSFKAHPDLLEIQQKSSAIVAFFHHSTKAADKLKEIQVQQKFPEKTLIQAVETRWNSVFHMWERLSEQKEVVTTVLCLLGKSSLCLSEEEWAVISLSINALRPFEEATREISTEKHVLVSKVIPLVSLLLRTTATSERQGSKLAAELSVQCLRRFRAIETCYGLAVSTYLDTRFKNLAFRDSTNVEPVKARLVTEMQSVSQTSAPSSSASSSSSSTSSAPAPATTSSSSAGAAASPPAAKGGIWTEFDTQVLASQQHQTTGTDVLIEIRRYSEERPTPRDQDPLLWWKNNASTFPSLSKLVKKHLGVVATSVPAERIFSKAGQLVRHRRCAIKAKNVNMILFLNKKKKKVSKVLGIVTLYLLFFQNALNGKKNYFIFVLYFHILYS